MLNLLLVRRQERLKSSEMVRRLNGIIAQLSGESAVVTLQAQRDPPSTCGASLLQLICGRIGNACAECLLSTGGEILQQNRKYYSYSLYMYKM